CSARRFQEGKCPKHKIYLNDVKVNYKNFSIYQNVSDLQYLHYENSFDLVICNEHKEDVTYETYIEHDELITQYKDFDAYKTSGKQRIGKIRNANVLGKVQMHINHT
ncbi:CYIR protein, partial [Plasmodium cynomolgi strain B]